MSEAQFLAAIEQQKVSDPGSVILAQGESASESLHPCAHCTQPGACQRCKRCGVAEYCDRQCQKAHWPVHKETCDPTFTDLLRVFKGEFRQIVLPDN